jgi:hypothetical protein
MIDQDFILLIMNCKKYTWKADAQRNTWLKKMPTYLKFYHVIGDENLETEYKFINKDSNNDENILYVKTLDDYNSLPKKVIASYKAISETFNYKYIFKTDDDQQLINEKFFDVLKNLLISKTSQTHYGGHMVDVNQPYLSGYYKLHPELPKYLPLLVTKYCSGRFYFLSSKAVAYLLTKREEIGKEYLEDYAIGYNLHNYFKLNLLNLQTSKSFKDEDDVKQDNLSINNKLLGKLNFV